MNGDSVWLTFILFDQYGYMATICINRIKKLYLYNQDGRYTGTSLSIPVYPRYIGFDTKERFVLISALPLPPLPFIYTRFKIK
jgi:hypothetical protein